MPIIRKNNSIYVTLGTCYSVWMSGMQGGIHLAYQSSIHNNKYQVSHKYSCFSWRWAHSRPKHVQNRNKHTKKNCAPSWQYLQESYQVWSRNLNSEQVCATRAVESWI